MSTLVKPDFDTELLEKSLFQNSIVLYNDDVNSFDHVIKCLVTLCDHQPEQAEQCAIIIHHKGKCDVKNGSLDELIPICKALLNEKLSAKIE